MRIFLDTADIEYIRQAARLGIVSGVTTNPTLLAKAGRADYRTAIEEICSLIPGPVSAEVLSQEVTSMVEEARRISAWAENIAIKLPATMAGIEATSTLARDGIDVNLTLCFSLNQALLGALAGAALGKLAETGVDKKFIKEVEEALEPNSSALFVISREGDPDVALAALRPYKGTVYHSSLDPEAEAELRRILDQEM